MVISRLPSAKHVKRLTLSSCCLEPRERTVKTGLLHPMGSPGSSLGGRGRLLGGTAGLGPRGGYPADVGMTSRNLKR